MITDKTVPEILTRHEQIKDDIISAVDEYINRLDDPQKIEQVSTFNGLILFVNSVVIRKYYDTTEERLSGDITTLTLLWDIYTQLCATYNKTITISQFSALCGFNSTVIYKWASGSSRSASRGHYHFAKMILQASEANIAGNIVDRNSIGSIFYSKAVFGWSEGAQVVEIRQSGSERSAAEIAAQYADLLPDQNGAIVELPDNLQAKKEPENADQV